MSVRVQTYVWQLELRPTQKLVAVALADHCHDDGSEARPSQATIVAKTGLSIRAVRNVLNELVDLGVIVLDRPSGQHRANVYRFLLPDDFATLRPAPGSSLKKIQTGISRTQTGISRHSDRHVVPPNHKEPLVETTANASQLSDAEFAAEMERRTIHSIPKPASFLKDALRTVAK